MKKNPFFYHKYWSLDWRQHLWSCWWRRPASLRTWCSSLGRCGPRERWKLTGCSGRAGSHLTHWSWWWRVGGWLLPLLGTTTTFLIQHDYKGQGRSSTIRLSPALRFLDPHNLTLTIILVKSALFFRITILLKIIKLCTSFQIIFWTNPLVSWMLITFRTSIFTWI